MQAPPQPSKTVLEQIGRPLAVVAILVVLLIVADLLNSYAWLLVGVFGAAGILAHVRYASQALLIAGAVLTGSAVGILLEATFNFTGAYLTSLGTAVAMVEFVTPRPGRLALWVGAAVGALGIGIGLFEAGREGWLLLCLLAAGFGAWLALRRS